MHVLIAGLYAATIWLSAFAYVLIVGGSVFRFLVLSPVIISAAIATIIALDFAINGVSWVWRRWRLAREN